MAVPVLLNPFASSASAARPEMTEVSTVSGITYFSGAGKFSSSRIGIGERVMINGRRGKITSDDGTSNPYKVTFDNGEVSGWLYPNEVTRETPDGWTVLDHSRKYANASAYDLDDPARVFCGTSAEPLGAKAGKQNSAFAFDGPNSQSMPYTLSVDMRNPETFTHWRVASNPHYGFDDAHLESWDSSKGQFVRVQGSEVHYWRSRSEDGFAYASFTSAVTSSKWRICITSYGNDSHYQARFQCYLTEAQFGRSPMARWRMVSRVIGPLMLAWRRAAERAYAPGGAGFDACHQEFAALAARDS
jgi:hypothetical protein